MAANGISTLASKEARQVAKLDAAQTKRKASGNTSATAYRPLNTYNINNLPTKSSGNSIVDNANAGGLIQGRPWIKEEANALDIYLNSGSINYLKGWYDSSELSSLADGTRVTQLLDKSIISNNLYSSNYSRDETRPIYKNSPALNNKGYIRFDGNYNILVTESIDWANSLSGYTIFVVAKWAGTHTGAWQSLLSTDNFDFSINRNFASGNWGVSHSGGYEASTNIPVDQNWNCHSLVFNGNGSSNNDKLKYRINKSDIVLSFNSNVLPTTSINNSGLAIGGHYSFQNWWSGDISEVIIFTKTLTSIEIQSVENYLSQKWGL